MAREHERGRRGKNFNQHPFVVWLNQNGLLKFTSDDFDFFAYRESWVSVNREIQELSALQFGWIDGTGMRSCQGIREGPLTGGNVTVGKRGGRRVRPKSAVQYVVYPWSEFFT